MKRRKRVNWEIGDTFLVPLKDKSFGLIQAIDFNMENIIYVAITNKRVTNIDETIRLTKDDIISLIAIHKEGLDFGEFLQSNNQDLIARKSEFRNEQFADQAYIGAKHYDYGLAQDFLNAYHKLDFWDDWYDPKYLDNFLVNMDKKPKKLLFKN